MVIGQFIDCFPPDLDGVGMVCKSYVQQLNSMGHKAYYIGPRPRSPYPVDFPMIEVPSVPVINEPYTCGIPQLSIEFHQTMKKLGLDIIHAHSPFLIGLDGATIAERQTIPLVASFHSKYYDDFLIKTGSKLIAESIVSMIIRFYNRCDEVWAVNNATADVLRDYGYKREITVMPNGTNLWYPTDEDRLAAQEKYNLGTGPVFLFVGQHAFKKNIKLIIEAVAVYRQRHEDFRMLFVGQGPDEQAIKNLVREKGLDDRIVFAGHLSDRNLMMQIFARADLFIFPSVYDNAPMVVREAAAAGTPSILMRGSCSAEGVTDNENGFLCENSPEDLAARIESALPMAAEVGARARQTIPLSWDKVMKMALERYEDLISRKTKLILGV